MYCRDIDPLGAEKLEVICKLPHGNFHTEAFINFPKSRRGNMSLSFDIQYGSSCCHSAAVPVLSSNLFSWMPEASAEFSL
jgi:hypothetical protein